MKQNSYITIPRSLHESDAWNKLTGEQVKAYLDLCFCVAFKEYECDSKFGKVNLEQGQIATSLRTLASNWNCDVSKVRRTLKSLEKNNLISCNKFEDEKATQDATQKVTLCTVVTINALHDSATQQATQKATHNKEEYNNNLSNDKFNTNTRVRKFVKPSEEEVQHELDLRGVTSFTGHDFWSYYESCGWTVGRNKPMKSWKDCITTWLRFEKKNDKRINNYHDREAEAVERRRKFALHIAQQLASADSDDDESDDLPF